MEAPADPAGHEQDGGHSGVLRDRVRVGGHAPRGGGSSHERIGKSKALIGRATQRFAHDAGHFAGDQSPGDSQSAITTSLEVAVRRQRRSCGPRRLREAPDVGDMTATMARQGVHDAPTPQAERWREYTHYTSIGPLGGAKHQTSGHDCHDARGCPRFG